MDGRPLHILMTDPHLRGGGQVRYVANLAGEFVRRGHTVTLGCKAGSVLVDRAAQAHCEAHDRFLFRGGLRLTSWSSDLAEARRFLLARRPDIIHVNGSQDHWVFGLANRLLGRPQCLVRTRHNTYRVSNSLPNRILNRAWTDYEIVVCQTVCSTLAAQSAFDGRRMCAIHNGVDAAAYQPDPEARREARAEFGYGEEHLVCGIAARLVDAKGHEFLFKAAAQLRNDLPGLRLFVLGQGDKEPDLRRLARDLGVADRVLFAGFRDDVARCVQAFDFGVQPSIDCDTSSFSLKEEMAAEKAVIASDYGGLTEIVTDGVEGLVVPAGTVDPLACAIRTLADDPDLRGRMGKAGRGRVLREFSIQAFASRTLDAYGRALGIHHERTAH